MIPPRAMKRKGAMILAGDAPPPPDQLAPYSVEQAQKIIELVGGTWWSRVLPRLIFAARSYRDGAADSKAKAEAREELRELFEAAYWLQKQLYSMSPAARRALRWSKQDQGIRHRDTVALMDEVQDKAAKHRKRGRPRDPTKSATLAFLFQVAREYWLHTGRNPGFSNPGGGKRSGKFVGFWRAAIAPFPDLDKKTNKNFDTLFREAMKFWINPDTPFGQAYDRHAAKWRQNTK